MGWNGWVNVCGRWISCIIRIRKMWRAGCSVGVIHALCSIYGSFFLLRVIFLCDCSVVGDLLVCCILVVLLPHCSRALEPDP